MAGAVALGHHAHVGGEPRALRWTTVGADLLVGRLTSAPGQLGQLLAEGVITQALTEPHGVWLWLDETERWSDWAPVLRDDLAGACAQVDQWAVSPDEDMVLAAIVEDVLQGELAEFIESHGGRIELRQVLDGVVTVELGGACAHCPLADVTMRQRVETTIRRRYPQLVELRDATASKPRQLFSFLGRGARD